MQSVSDDDVQKRLLEKPRFELAAKGVFRLGRCYIFWQGVPGLCFGGKEQIEGQLSISPPPRCYVPGTIWWRIKMRESATPLL